MAGLAGHVRYAVVDDRVIVLDLRRGNYVTLPRELTTPWNRLAQGKPPADAADLNLARQAQLAGYLTDIVTPVASRTMPARRLPLALAAFRQLTTARLAIRRRGFPTVYRQLSELRHFSPRRKIVGVERVTAAFLQAEGLLPGGLNPRDCLPRSIALFRLLLASGMPAQHVIGVRTEPFEAHAWVELENRALLEDSDDIAKLTPIATLQG